MRTSLLDSFTAGCISLTSADRDRDRDRQRQTETETDRDGQRHVEIARWGTGPGSGKYLGQLPVKPNSGEPGERSTDTDPLDKTEPNLG